MGTWAKRIFAHDDGSQIAERPGVRIGTVGFYNVRAVCAVVGGKVEIRKPRTICFTLPIRMLTTRYDFLPDIIPLPSVLFRVQYPFRFVRITSERDDEAPELIPWLVILAADHKGPPGGREVVRTFWMCIGTVGPSNAAGVCRGHLLFHTRSPARVSRHKGYEEPR